MTTEKLKVYKIKCYISAKGLTTDKEECIAYKEVLFSCFSTKSTRLSVIFLLVCTQLFSDNNKKGFGK